MHDVVKNCKRSIFIEKKILKMHEPAVFSLIIEMSKDYKSNMPLHPRVSKGTGPTYALKKNLRVFLKDHLLIFRINY